MSAIAQKIELEPIRFTDFCGAGQQPRRDDWGELASTVDSRLKRYPGFALVIDFPSESELKPLKRLSKRLGSAIHLSAPDRLSAGRLKGLDVPDHVQ